MSELASTPQIRGQNPYQAARKRRNRGAYQNNYAQPATQADMFANPENAILMHEALTEQSAAAPLLPPEAAPRPPQPEARIVLNLGERLHAMRSAHDVYDHSRAA